MTSNKKRATSKFLLILDGARVNFKIAADCLSQIRRIEVFKNPKAPIYRMPTVQNIYGPYRIFFYSFDCNEPMHVHVRREKMTCKFWLEPIALSENHGFSPNELNRIRRMIQDNIEKIIEAWHEHCS